MVGSGEATFEWHPLGWLEKEPTSRFYKTLRLSESEKYKTADSQGNSSFKFACFNYEQFFY
jgi:hypothetical protein